MDLVQERHVKTAELHRQLNMPGIVVLITVGQLRFLTRIAKMDESRVTRQVMNSQVVRTKDTNIKGGNKLASRSAYRNALHSGGVMSDEENKVGILTDTWTRRLCNPKIGEVILR